MSDGTHLWESVRDEAMRRGADPAGLRRLILAPTREGGAGWRWWYEEKTTPELAAWLLEQLPPAPQGAEPMETTLQRGWRLGDPRGVAGFVNWWDEAPRAEARALLLAEVALALAGRRPAKGVA